MGSRPPKIVTLLRSLLEAVEILPGYTFWS